MNGKFKKSVFGFLCVLIFAFFAESVVANISPEIVPAESGSYRGANEPIRINFPPNISNEVYQQLALELDAIDISGLVSFEGDQLIYNPVQPLQFGPHELRLVQYLEDGSIEEVALWTFEVRQSASFRNIGYRFNSTLKATHRAAEDIETDNGSSIDHENGFQGGADVTIAGANENYSVSLRSNFLADHQSDNTPRGEEFDLGNYLLQLNATEYASFKAGHHNIDYTSLTHSGFHRRGISGEFQLPFLKSSVQGFSMRAGDVTGFNHGLGVSDSDNLINGIVWNYQPLSSSPENLIIKLSHLNGEREQEGFNIGGLTESNAGDASSISGDLLLLDRTVRIYSELSQSNYDFDGEGEGFGKEKDNAYHSFITYSPISSNETDNSIEWNIGLEKLVVGSDFKSLANTFLASDKDMTRIFAGIQRGPWSGDISFAYEENNLDNDFEATGIGRYGYLNGYYTASEPYSDSGFFGWLGIPSYGISYQYTANNQAGVEVPLIGIDEDDDGMDDVEIIKTDLTQQSVSLSTNFSSNEGAIYKGLSVSFDWAEFQDHAERFSDSQTVGFSFGPHFKFGKISVYPSIQAVTTHERDTNFDDTSVTYSLDMGGIFIENKLSGRVTFSYTDRDAENEIVDQFDGETLDIRGNLVWSLFQPDGIRPGVDLRLTGSYQDLNQDVRNPGVPLDNYDEYQIFFNVDVNWGIRKPSSFY